MAGDGSAWTGNSVPRYMGSIRYMAGYKYQLNAPFVATLPTAFAREAPVITKHIWISQAGLLTIHPGYAWDGPSGPLWDSRKMMRASLVHDALYQLLRRDLLEQGLRKQCDLLFKELCIADGVRRIWAHLMYKALRRFGASSAEQWRPVHTAP